MTPPDPIDLRAFAGARRAEFTVPAPAGEPGGLPEVAGLLAGAAEVDLTPPPGMPKAGYSANAHDGDGFRTRLRARVVHLRSGRSSLALVQCDLLGGSSVLHHLVAQRIARDTDVPIEGLAVQATHTHAGPGQFLGTDFYNRFASNRPGFDPRWSAELVERIAGAVVEAVDRRRPAVAGVATADVFGATRNRSLAPHVANPEVADKRTEPQRKFHAVNPELTLLRVDAVEPDGSTVPLSANLWFSVHGTGISMHAHDYNADLWSYLVTRMRLRCSERGAVPVVGAAQATHADVAPAIRPGMAGHLEARRIGEAVGERAAELYASMAGTLSAEVPLGAALREVDAIGEPGAGGVTIARPAVGAALVAGAKENTTPVVNRIPPFRAGTPRPHRAGSPHGAKWVIGSTLLQPVVIPPASLPALVPVQVLRIGDTLLCGLPFEITVQTGRRFAERALEHAPEGVVRAVVTSVTNEYFGYCTTAEEYAHQYYEGGHTLFGPNSERYFAAHVGRLAGELAGGGVRDVPAERRFSLKVRTYFPAASPGTPPPPREIGPAAYHDPTANEDGWWEWSWEDAAPGDLRWDRPMARIEAAGPDGLWGTEHHHGLPVDDQSHQLQISHLGASGGRHRYRLRWYDPVFAHGRRHRAVLLDPDGGVRLDGTPFD